MNDGASEEPKLIIDEDWKSQVQREKEEFKRKQEHGTTEADSHSGENAAPTSKQEEEQLPPPPPPSLPFLITSLATQAMASLGQIPDEDGNPLPMNLAYARHFIDLIAVLEEKTQGNLTDEEKSYLQETLHQLRMIFVAVSQKRGS